MLSDLEFENSPFHPKRPGNPADLTTFVSCFENEAILAAYLGFHDIGTLRKFYFSEQQVEVYLLYATYLKRCASRKTALQIVKDHCELVESIDFEFKAMAAALELDEVDASLGISARRRRLAIKKKVLFAAIVLKLVSSAPQEDIKPVSRKASTEQLDNLARLMKANDQNSHLPGLKLIIPHLDFNEVNQPVYGPFGQESYLEPYNRAVNLFFGMNRLFSPAYFMAGFHSKRGHDPFIQPRVPDAARPLWLARQSSTTSSVTSDMSSEDIGEATSETSSEGTPEPTPQINEAAAEMLHPTLNAPEVPESATASSAPTQSIASPSETPLAAESFPSKPSQPARISFNSPQSNSEFRETPQTSAKASIVPPKNSKKA
ncbi:MAG: hypothetical protein M1814_001628 [Vezdaea aestivalis]|nr:MAG: hypothetical protein M1814_001628 [Vezdaea aestivalis]